MVKLEPRDIPAMALVVKSGRSPSQYSILTRTRYARTLMIMVGCVPPSDIMRLKNSVSNPP